ncbi:hypothetical protein KY339_01335 [Candidatus Woesearchaeota archaeon]|nr:hypothetical protein [Candidatus Woesearchaeota archaeon]
MAKIGIKNIDSIKLNVIPLERRFDSEGDLAVDPRVAEMYVNKGHDLAPKSWGEAKILGVKHFNGLMSSFTRILVYRDPKETIVTADIAPTRYLIGQAMRDVVKESGGLTPENIKKLSPDMANVSLVAPVKVEGKYFLLSQIKGKALGSGQVHSGLVAGNVDAKYLDTPNPLTATLRNECSEEVGMDLSYLGPTSFIFMVDERETGQVNFACVAKEADLHQILNSYEAMTRHKISKHENLEVMALSVLPIAGLALVPLEEGKEGLKNITCYKPTAGGLEERVEDRTVRPYTQATVDYISHKENVKFLLEKAGF